MTDSLPSPKVAVAGVTLAAGIGTLAAVVLLAVFSGPASAVDLPPVARQMHAFTAPPLRPGALPLNVRAGLQGLADPASQGSPRFDQARLLREGLGVNRVGLYAVPTTGGVVCFLINERTYAATCASEFSSGQGRVAAMLFSGEGTPFTVAGLAPDSVEGVSVVVNGQVRTASLRDNVFFWQSDSPSITRESLDELRVTRDDGSSLTVDVP